MANIIADLEWRYAVKKFDAEKILPQDKIDKLKQAFNLTATSYGLQPIKMIVVSDKQIQEKLVSYSFDQKQVAQASHVLVLCIETKVDDDYILSYFRRVQQVRGTSDEILDPFKQAMVKNFRTKKTQEIKEWAAKQAYLALGNLLTICAVERIDSCPMEGFLPAEYDQVLKLEEMGLNSVLVLPVGYRAEDDMFQDFKKVRRSMDTSVIDINGED